MDDVDQKKQFEDFKNMKSNTSKKEPQHIDNEHYDEAYVMHDSDDNLNESKTENKNAYPITSNADNEVPSSFQNSKFLLFLRI